MNDLAPGVLWLCCGCRDANLVHFAPAINGKVGSIVGSKANEVFDVIVVGGGPSGLMASVAASTVGARTLLIEKGNRLGRKLGISGGGRCNVTNAKSLPELMQNIPGNGRFLYSALNRFSNTDIMAFFEELGIRLKEEDRGRVFPISDKADTVVQALIDKVYESGVTVWPQTPVRRLHCEDGRVQGVFLHNQQRVEAKAIVVATGGCSVPKTGSTGDAYPWAKEIGHAIVDPFPTEVPLTSRDWFIRERTLQGLSLRGVNITIADDTGKKLTTEQGDVLFTHFGLSGPVALRCSHYVSTSLRQHPSTMLTATIDCLPDTSQTELLAALMAHRKQDSRKQIDTVLSHWLPDRLVTVILETARVDAVLQMANLNNDAMARLAQQIKAFPVAITGTLPLAQATVTGGGVSIRDIDPKTMASRLCQGLYFAGEVMDVHAHTGGYNITVAFSTGHSAGSHAGWFSKLPLLL